MGGIRDYKKQSKPFYSKKSCFQNNQKQQSSNVIPLLLIFIRVAHTGSNESFREDI